MPWAAAAGFAGSLISSGAAGDAADAQSAAAARTDETNRYIFDEQKKLQEPFRQTGLNANNRLAYLMGLSTSPNGGGSGGSAMTYEQARNQLLPQYTTTTGGPDQYGNYPRTMEGVGASDMTDSPRTTSIDEAGLSAAIQSLMQGQGGQAAGDPNDPAFGSLMRRFSMQDFEEDPGYQFRKEEGMRGVEGSAAARGGLLSGAALKAIQKYGQGLASQEYGNAYQRYTGDQTNQYNRLAGMVNTGQGATNQVQNAAAQYGANTASNNAALGNAQAAGSIGQANALTQGIGGAYNNYQYNELLKKIQRPGVNMGTATGSDLSLFYGG
jgi:hypothetical protein